MTDTPTPADPGQFSSWLAGFTRGALDDELTAGMREVAQAVTMLGKPGTVTLKLTFSVPPNTGDGVVVAADVKSAPPKTKRAAFYFVTDDGALSKRDPNQLPIPGTEAYQED